MGSRNNRPRSAGVADELLKSPDTHRYPRHPFQRSDFLVALFMSERQPAITVRSQKKVYSPKTGEHIDTIRQLVAEFRKGGVPTWALPIAENTFKMGGKPPGLPPQVWLNTYDSDLDAKERGWTEEEKALIEAKLRSKGYIVEIVPTKPVAPWPTYDKIVVQGKRTIVHVAEKIASEVSEGGIDPADVIVYERANLNRAEVIAALEGLSAEEEEAEPLVAS